MDPLSHFTSFSRFSISEHPIVARSFKTAEVYVSLGESSKAFDIYSEYCNDKNPQIAAEANYRMGKLCQQFNPTMVAELLETAANLGHLKARYDLGIWYVEQQCDELALGSLTEASTDDLELAMSKEDYLEIAKKITQSEGDLHNEQSEQLVLTLLGRAAAKGSPAAFYKLGKNLLTQNTEQSYECAIENFTVAAQLLKEGCDAEESSGEERAKLYSQVLYTLGQCYEEGFRGKNQDAQRAEECFMEATKTADPCAPASYAVGLLCLAKEDIEGALTHFNNAAQKGHAGALFKLSEIHFHKAENLLDRTAVFSVRSQAQAYLIKAAEAGHVEAQLKLATFYDKKATEAEKRQEESKTHAHLGTPFSSGAPIGESDRQSSIRYYTMASTAGNSDASFQLGMIYLHGKGVAKDKEEARTYLKLAVTQGSQLAAEELRKLGDSPWSFKKIKHSIWNGSPTKLKKPKEDSVNTTQSLWKTITTPPPTPPRFRTKKTKDEQQ